MNILDVENLSVKVEGKVITMEVRNRLDKGDKLELLTPEKTISLTLSVFKNAENGKPLTSASAGQGFSITFNSPEAVEVGDVARKRLSA